MNDTAASHSSGTPKPGAAPLSAVSLPITIPDHEMFRCIGRGSYGAVWLARNSFGTYRAVKVLHRQAFTTDRPFQRELSGIRSFEPISRSHEGFVDILQVGINAEQGCLYYVMELGDDAQLEQPIHPERYVPRTLARELARRGQLPFQECLQLGLGLSDALASLHRHGLVHRDIKPSNIIFVGGVPKLADIGLVSAIDDARSYVGTEGFIPPEGPGTPQADIYSLGKLLYEASTGKDRQEFPDLPPGFDQTVGTKDFLELNEVILHACQNDLHKRYRSAELMHADLQVLAAGKSVRRLHLLERRFSSIKRASALSVAGAALAALLLYPVYVHWRDATASRLRQVGADLAYGTRAVESGDLAGALPYFVDALQLDSGNPQREAQHRLRLGSALALSPRLVQMWVATQQVDEVEFSLDGSKVLLVESFGAARVLDVSTGLPVSPAFGQKTFLWRGSLNPAGDRAVLAGEDQTARVWRVADGVELLRLEHPDKVLSAEFSPDGSRIVTGCRDKLGRVWDAQTGRAELALRGHEEALLFGTFSPDGKRIVTTGKDSTARLWDARDGHSLGPVLRHSSWIYFAAFGPRSELVTAGFDHEARLWDLETGQEILPRLSHPDGVKSAEFSPDGRLILTACLDGTARIWSRTTHLPWSKIPLLRHSRRLTHARFSPDGSRVVTSSVDGGVRIWDLAGTALAPKPFRSVFSADKSRYVISRETEFEVCDSFSGQPVSVIKDTPPLGPALLSEHGDFLLTSSKPGSGSPETIPARLWECQSGKPLGPSFTLTNAARSFIVSPDRRVVVIAGASEISAWNTQESHFPPSSRKAPHLALLWAKQLEPATVGGLALRPAGGAVTLWTANEVYCVDLANGRELLPPIKHDSAIRDLALSPDGKWFVTSAGDDGFTPGHAQLWDASTGRPGLALRHSDGVVRAAFSPDSSRLVTSSEDFTARIWEVGAGAPLGPPMRHRDRVFAAAFSHDGRSIVTASADGSARVWSADTGDPLTPPFPHLRPVFDARFLNHDKAIITLDVDGRARVFELKPDFRPAEDLARISRLLSGDTIVPAGTRSLPGESLLVIWQRLRSRYPADFSDSSGQVSAWHLSQADESEQEQQWSAAAYHLRRLCALAPLDSTFRQRLEQVEKLAGSSGN